MVMRAGTELVEMPFGMVSSCLYCGQLLYNDEEWEFHFHRKGYLYCRGFDVPIHAEDCGVRHEEDCTCWVKDVDNYMLEEREGTDEAE